jgi:hypothetical protein
LSEITEVSTNENALHATALDRFGHVWSWGNNSQGQLGNGQFISDQSGLGVVKLSMEYSVSRIYAGAFLNYATTDDGRLLAWGSCPLSGSDLRPVNTTPYFVDDVKNIKALSPPDFDASDPVVVLRQNGSVYRIQPNKYALFSGGGNCTLRQNATADHKPLVAPEKIDFGDHVITEIAGGNPLTLHFLFARSSEGTVMAVDAAAPQSSDSLHLVPIKLTTQRD